MTPFPYASLGAGAFVATMASTLSGSFCLPAPDAFSVGPVQLHILALSWRLKGGGVWSAPPGSSDVNLLRYCDGVVDLYAEVSDGALDLRVPQQELHRPQIACAPIDQGRFRASERMCPE
jgi:hypothetical protein